MDRLQGGRLAPATRHAVADLARAVLSLRPLAEAGDRLRVVAGGVPAAPAGCLDPVAVATEVSRCLGVPLTVTRGPAASAGDDVFATIAAGRLAPALSPPALATAPATCLDEVAGVARAAADASLEAHRARDDVVTADGARLRTWALGDRRRPAVVMASACGMPAQLCEPWMRALASERFVVTWEVRGLFGESGDAEHFDRIDHDVRAQAGDLLAVMDHHGVGSAHVMGLCGGAVVALRAAAAAPGRVASLSLWHGDFELGPGCPKTGHQHNLKALMALAAASRADAAAINDALRHTAMAAVPPGVAHLVVYPYRSAELFYRYCVLTGAIMSTDVRELLGGVAQPTLVVTSEDDRTAHPAGSHAVAGALPAATLRVEPHGDHLSAFGAAQPLRRAMADFLAAA